MKHFLIHMHDKIVKVLIAEDFSLGLSKGIHMNKHAPCAKERMLHMIQNYDRANITVQKYIYFLHI